MALIEKKQELSQGKEPLKLEKTPPPKEEKKDISGFGGKRSLTREEFRGWLKKPEAWKASRLPQTERVKLEKELFEPKKFGHFIERGEPEKRLKKLKMEKFQAKTQAERSELSKKIKLMKRFLGK